MRHAPTILILALLFLLPVAVLVLQAGAPGWRFPELWPELSFDGLGFLAARPKPFLTALAYLIVRGGGMAERANAQVQQNREAAEAYVREVAGTGPAAEIASAKQLLDSGAITPEEFAKLKAAALAKA